MSLGSNDSEATTLLEASRRIQDVSPTESLFPEILSGTTNTTVIAEPRHNKPPPPIRRPETIDPRCYPPVIPPKHPNRTLVLCFDGTGDQFDADNSNIVQLVSLLKKDDSTKQLVYYQSGIGTYISHKHSTSFLSSIQKTLDVMIGWSIDTHVMSTPPLITPSSTEVYFQGGYKFLMQNYIKGDKICLFGFSRGAYTARSLAGMLYKVGLLPAGNFQQVPFAYRMYTREDILGWALSNEFKKDFCVDVSIEFIGVWDTVSSLGIVPKSLPVTTASTLTRTFRHALSLDERRAKFQANLWDLLTDKNLGEDCNLGNPTIETDAEEVWFAGCHCDVGGGAVSNRTRHSLARIPLRWMIRECFKTNTGIMFNSDSLFDIGLDPSTLYPFVTPRPPPTTHESPRIQKLPTQPIPIKTKHLLVKKKGEKTRVLGRRDPKIPKFLGTEEEEELYDAISPKYDQLKLRKAWWILEILPFPFQRGRGGGGGDDDWVRYFGPHLGIPRFIPHQKLNGLKIHRSVKLRMRAEFDDERARQRDKKYFPKAQFHVEPTWVD